MSVVGDHVDSQALPTQFHIWGARGSRNTVGSRIANSTSCYSLAVNSDLFVFDGGSGLLHLSAALLTDQRLRHITHVYLLISHAHWDHWEGVKDAEWMWRKDNGLELMILGPKEALDAMRQTCEPPSFIRLEILALGTLASLSFVEVVAGESIALSGATVEPLPLRHYSGIAPNRLYLEALGYRLVVDGGPTVAYLCDHEPTDEGSEMEQRVVSSADLAVLDASYGDVSEHAFGHGSIEWAARLARRSPKTRVLAGHHGPLRSDEDTEDAATRHGSDLERFAIAIEGATEQWDESSRMFSRLRSTRDQRRARQ